MSASRIRRIRPSKAKCARASCAFRKRSRSPEAGCAKRSNRSVFHPGTRTLTMPALRWLTTTRRQRGHRSTAHTVSWNGWLLELPTDPLSRDECLTRVRTYRAELGLRRYQAWVFGPVARGDFTKESDTDVLVISDELPVDRKRRLDGIFDARTVAAEIEPIGWLASEWREREANNDPFLDILKREAVLVENAACPQSPSRGAVEIFVHHVEGSVCAQ